MRSRRKRITSLRGRIGWIWEADTIKGRSLLIAGSLLYPGSNFQDVTPTLDAIPALLLREASRPTYFFISPQHIRSTHLRPKMHPSPDLPPSGSPHILITLLSSTAYYTYHVHCLPASTTTSAYPPCPSQLLTHLYAYIPHVSRFKSIPLSYSHFLLRYVFFYFRVG